MLGHKVPADEVAGTINILDKATPSKANSLQRPSMTGPPRTSRPSSNNLLLDSHHSTREISSRDASSRDLSSRDVSHIVAPHPTPTHPTTTHPTTTHPTTTHPISSHPIAHHSHTTSSGNLNVAGMHRTANKRSHNNLAALNQLAENAPAYEYRRQQSIVDLVSAKGTLIVTVLHADDIFCVDPSLRGGYYWVKIRLHEYNHLHRVSRTDKFKTEPVLCTRGDYSSQEVEWTKEEHNSFSFHDFDIRNTQLVLTLRYLRPACLGSMGFKSDIGSFTSVPPRHALAASSSGEMDAVSLDDAHLSASTDQLLGLVVRAFRNPNHEVTLKLDDVPKGSVTIRLKYDPNPTRAPIQKT